MTIAYWERLVATGEPAFEWPLDDARAPAPSYLRESAERVLSGAAVTFERVLAAFALVAHRQAGQEVLWLAAAVDGALLPLRIEVPGGGTAAELTAATSRALEASKANRVPFADVSAVANRAGVSTLARCLLLPEGAPRVSRLGAAAADCDLILSMRGATLHIDYDSELFRPATIERLLSQLDAVLAADAGTPIAAVPLLSVADRARALADGNATQREYERDACVHTLIERQAARTPDAKALTFAGQTLSYAELNAQANRLARALIERGVGPDTAVGVCVERSIEMVVSVLAVLKAGSAYIPMDPAYPAQRIAYMAQDSKVRLVLADRALPDVAADVLRVDQPLPAADDTNPAPRAAWSNLAYIIYTSGSTGLPKGVMVEHRNVVNFFAGMDDRLGTDPGVWLAVTSLSFDISVLELLWTLSHGFEVVLHSSRPAPLRASRNATNGGMDFGLFYFASDEGDYAKASGRDKYKLLIDGAKFADERGFTAVWTPERHFHTFGGLYPSPSVAAGALAMCTQSVQIRAGSVVLPLHNPVRVAEEWSLVDNLSDGRVGISFASGWQPQDFAIAPQAFADRHNGMFDAIATVRALWRGESITLPGGDGKPVQVSTRPRPVQRELPVFVTAGGSPETFRRAGEIGAGVLTHLLGQSIEQLTDRIKVYRDAWAKAGHQGPGRVVLMLHTFVSDNLQHVRDTVHEPLKNYLKGSVGLFAPVAAAKGLDVNNLSPADLEALAEFAFERYFETSGLFGTPESCAPMVVQLKSLGVDELACLIDFGIAADTVLANLPHLDALRVRCGGMSATTQQPKEIGDLLREHPVTHMQCTPSMAGLLLADARQAAGLSKLQRMMVGGEALPEALAAELRAAMPGGLLTNMYGPTETTVWSTTHDVDEAPGPVPLGTPIANTQIWILDAAFNPVPAGVVGELFIGGDGVARGYFERPQLNAERFIANPHTGARMYRTGDLARRRTPEAGGTIDFLGRADFQVKLRGYRIELGEIEAALRSNDAAVAEAAVVVREDTPGDKRLVAYLLARRDATIDADALRARLREALTDFMQPSAIVVLQEFPRTPNGKLDRNALATVEPQAAASAPPVTAPERAPTIAIAMGEVQDRIAVIWRDVLKVPSVGPRDNFFDLGGHSLLVVHVLNKLREFSPRELSMTDLFRFPTVETLAAHLAQALPTASEAANRPDVLSAGQQRAAMRRAQLRGRG
jgi:natural product biosynthesis luciferase-like monooxygenase protein